MGSFAHNYYEKTKLKIFQPHFGCFEISYVLPPFRCGGIFQPKWIISKISGRGEEQVGGSIDFLIWGNFSRNFLSGYKIKLQLKKEIQRKRKSLFPLHCIYYLLHLIFFMLLFVKPV